VRGGRPKSKSANSANSAKAKNNMRKVRFLGILTILKAKIIEKEKDRKWQKKNSEQVKRPRKVCGKSVLIRTIWSKKSPKRVYLSKLTREWIEIGPMLTRERTDKDLAESAKSAKSAMQKI